jgi:hypothetical protein
MLRNRNRSRSLKILSVCFCVPLLGSIAASLTHPDAAVAGGFSQTCWNQRIESDESGRIVLVASCEDRGGLAIWNDDGRARTERRLIISDFIANYEGNLAWAHNGNFQASCKDFEYTQGRWTSIPGPRLGQILDRIYEPAELHATCGDGKGGEKRTSIKLDEKISNQAGVLAVDNF